MYVCGLITQQRLKRLGSNSSRVFSLDPGWFQAKKNLDPVTGSPENRKNRFSMVFHILSFTLFFETIETTYVVGRGAAPSNPQRRWRLAAKSASKIQTTY